MNKNAIKITLLLASMLTILANAIIAPALPAINTVFADEAYVEVLSKFLMTLPALTIAIFSPFIGKQIDKLGRLKLLYAALLVFAIAGTAGLWVNSLTSLLVSRLFLGFGVAGIMTVTTTLIGDYFKNAEREKFISLQGAFTGIGGLLFITSAGYLADINWRLPFAIYGFSLVILLLAYNYLVEPKNETIESNVNGDDESQKNTAQVIIIYTTAFIGIIFFYILPLQIPFYVKSFSNATNSMSGWAIGALTLAQAIASLFYKKLKANFSPIFIYGISFSIMAIGYAFISFSTSYWQIVVSLIISGFGVAWLLPNSTLWLLAITPENQRGRNIGRLTTFIFLGQFASPVVVQPLNKAVGLQNTFFYLSITLLLLGVGYFAYGIKKLGKL